MKLMTVPILAGLQLLALVAPAQCPGCGGAAGRIPGYRLCARCRPRSQAVPYCRRCGQWLHPSPMLVENPVWVCRSCRRWPNLVWARSVAPYEGAWRNAVIHLKRSPGGELMEQAIHWSNRTLRRMNGPAWEALVPVPARPGSGRVHAAEVLAKGLARTLGVGYEPALHFVRTTYAQHGLTRPERIRNMRQSLRSHPRVRGRSLLVVDDVLTTGATALEALRALRQAGARKVGVFTLARTRDRF